jgi:hypothetical protein
MLDKDFVPLYQTLLWVLLAVIVVIALRRDLGRLRDALVRRVESGGALDLGPIKFGELKAELQTVRNDLTRVENVVAELFLATMSAAMFENLRKLASGTFGPYHLGQALERELYHLRDIGYISVPSVKAIPKDGPELSEYVKVTDPGKKFVELRTQLQRS